MICIGFQIQSDEALSSLWQVLSFLLFCTRRTNTACGTLKVRQTLKLCGSPTRRFAGIGSPITHGTIEFQGSLCGRHRSDRLSLAGIEISGARQSRCSFFAARWGSRPQFSDHLGRARSSPDDGAASARGDFLAPGF